MEKKILKSWGFCIVLGNRKIKNSEKKITGWYFIYLHIYLLIFNDARKELLKLRLQKAILNALEKSATSNLEEVKRMSEKWRNQCSKVKFRMMKKIKPRFWICENSILFGYNRNKGVMPEDVIRTNRKKLQLKEW